MSNRFGSPSLIAGTTTKEYAGKGGMIAWMLPRQLAEQLALADGEKPSDLHMTLCFFPDFAGLDVTAVAAAMERVSLAFKPLRGTISGVARFSLPDEDAVVALVDVPDLSKLREALVWELAQRSVEYANNHGFTPHVTLRYIAPEKKRLPVERIEPRDVAIRTLTLANPAGVVGTIVLGGTAFGAKDNDDEPARAGPFENERLRLERRLQRAVQRGLNAIQRNVERELERQARQKALTDLAEDEEFWGLQRTELMEAVGTLPEDLILEGAVQAQRLGLAFNFTQVHTEALDLARTYRNTWWDQLDRTTRSGLRRAVATHIQDGTSMRVLRNNISPMFGRARAEMIASTEVTRLFAEGNRQAYAAAGIDQVQWKTVVDGLVDPDCRALHNRRMALGREEAVPPAHTRCRCWLAPVVDDRAISAAIDQDLGPFEAKDVKTIEDLKKFAELPQADAVYEYFTHAVRRRSDVEGIVKGGIRPGNTLEKVFASSTEDVIRERGSGYVVFRARRGVAAEGRDFVEEGLVYREFTLPEVARRDVVRVVRVVEDRTGFRIGEDELARFALENQGLTTGADVESLPALYRKWFVLSG